MQIYEQVFDEPGVWRHSARQDRRVTIRCSICSASVRQCFPPLLGEPL